MSAIFLIAVLTLILSSFLSINNKLKKFLKDMKKIYTMNYLFNLLMRHLELPLKFHQLMEVNQKSKYHRERSMANNLD